ncbi:zinc finger protein 768-like isoform X2 [Entelurus aequoreus]|uniref:zinc finger protein 768-like isoform X2 n=1 Tax=Entelurus aequoreus TaxID=161455 RepID=UPI002B1E84DD|nr:zinc finger protein 768-like isoform X2 [Entelurus aequoreus]
MLRWRLLVKVNTEKNQRHQLPATHQRRKRGKKQIQPRKLKWSFKALECCRTQRFRTCYNMDDNCYAKMATRREDGKESAPPTTSNLSTDKKRNIADKDVQPLIGHSPQPQGISTWKEENIHSLHVKEEEEELQITRDECRQGPTEADLAKLLLTVVSVKTEDREDKPQDQQLIGHQDEHSSQPQEISTLKQENLHFFHVKKEEEELCITPEGEFIPGPEQADPTKLPLTVASVKTEDHGDELQADNLLAPLSNSEAEDSVKEPSSSDTDCEDIQQLTGHQEEPQEISTSKQENIHSVNFKEEELWITRGQCLLGPKEADPTMLPLTVVSVKTEDYEDKTQDRQLTGHLEKYSPQVEEVFTLKHENPHSLRFKKEEEEFRITQDSERKRLRGPEEADPTKLPLTVKSEDYEDKPQDQQLTGHREEYSLKVEEIFTLKHENPHSLRFKKEEEEFRITQDSDRKCLRGPEEADPTKLPLTVKSEDYEDKPQAENLLAPLSDSEAEDLVEEPLGSDTDYEGDRRTQTDNKLSKKKKKEPLTCLVCAKSFTQKSLLTRHMKTHKGEKPFSCSVCGAKFTLKSSMVRHMNTHTGVKPFSCSVCSKRFLEKKNMERHAQTHTGEKPFSCSVCGKRFTQKGTIATHMSTHAAEKAFSCPVCGKRFTFNSSLARHINTHKGEKPFSCSVCDKRFLEKVDVKRHMRTHTGEKPYGCSVCSKRFSQRGSMLTHMSSHIEGKPFGCSVCGQRFFLEPTMTRHMKTHTGQRPFSCTVCGKNYIFQAHLTEHMQTHSKK